METQEQTLHQQKVTILSRLIKETSLTLEEALLLLKEEEPTQIAVDNGNRLVINPSPWSNPGTLGTSSNPWFSTSTPSTHIRFNTTGNVGIGTSSPGVLTTNTADATINN